MSRKNLWINKNLYVILLILASSVGVLLVFKTILLAYPPFKGKLLELLVISVFAVTNCILLALSRLYLVQLDRAMLITLEFMEQAFIVLGLLIEVLNYFHTNKHTQVLVDYISLSYLIISLIGLFVLYRSLLGCIRNWFDDE